MSVVIDASVALSWCFGEELTPPISALLRQVGTEIAYVPNIWSLEVSNVLLGAIRRNRISYARAAEFLSLLGMLKIEMDVPQTFAQGLHETFLLAHSEGLTSYDAAYLELAIRKGLPLATRDKALVSAANRLGIVVMPLEN